MALNRIKEKLVADCSQCDALCCNAPKFDCHGAGQAVTTLFRNLGYNNQNDKKTEKIKYDVFIGTFLYLSDHFFPDQKIQTEFNKPNKKRLTPFINKAIEILEEDLDQTL